MFLERTKQLLKYLTYCLVLVSGLFVAPSKAIPTDFSLPDRPFKIAVLENNPPFSLRLPNGELVGLYIDIWNLWSDKTGIEIKFHSGNYADNLESLQNGISDIQSGLFMNAERSVWADFSIPIHRVATSIYVSSNTRGPIEIEGFSNKRIAVGTDSFQQSYLKEHHPNIILLDYKDPKQSILSLLEGRVDAMVSEQPFIDAQLSIMGIKGALTRSRSPLLVNTVHALVPKGRTKLLKLINKGLSSIDKKDLIIAEKKWLPGYDSYFDSPAFGFLRGLSYENQLWLRKHVRLDLSYQSNYFPFSFDNERGQYSGISSDYIQLISRLLDIKIIANSYLVVGDSQAIKSLEADIYPTVQNRLKTNSDMIHTVSYAKFPVVIVSTKESDYIRTIEDLEGLKIGVGNIGDTATIIKEKYPSYHFIFFSRVGQALDKLENGEIDAYIDNLALVSYDIKNANRSQIKIASPTPYFIAFSIGLKAELAPLQSIINKILLSVSKNKKNSLEANWLDYQLKSNPQYQNILRIAIPLMIFMGLFIIYIYRSNRRMAREIKSRLVMEKGLASETKKAERANRAKTEFVSNMSHDIRTPMNSIVGLVQLLEQTQLDKEQKSYLSTLLNSTSSLQNIIEDILDLSDIVKQELTINYQNFELDKLIDTIIDQANYRAKNSHSHLQIKVIIAPEIGPLINGDPTRLGQILVNLLSNAIKFTEQGLIAIEVALQEQQGDQLKLLFKVKDNGIGMSPEQQSRLFQTYSQADSSTTRKYGGTGLGLSICKTLCEAMGGDIWVESKESIGSTFFFTLLFYACDKSASYCELNCRQAVPEPPKARGKSSAKVYFDTSNLANKYRGLVGTHLLVVDDNETNLMIVVSMLEKFGIKVSTANNGLDCIEFLKNNCVALILMDLQMPIMDGYQATQMIRQNDKYPNLPIIAFSANVMDSDIQRALDAGMNYHFPKPFSIAELLKMLSEQITIQPKKLLDDR